MKIEQCFVGIPVIYQPTPTQPLSVIEQMENMLGHITGFTYNGDNNILPSERIWKTLVMVKWANGTETAIHPDYIKKFI